MSITKEKPPKVISVTDQEFEQLKNKIENSNLGEREKKIMLTVLEGYYWLSSLYHTKRLSMKRIARLFGHKSEKQEKKDKGNDKNEPPSPTAPPPKKDKQEKGHGKRGAKDFPGAKKVSHKLDGLKKGDPCPECPVGKLYPVDPGSYIHFTGNAPLDATIHETEKLRCNACGSYFEAQLNDELKEKYHPSADVAIAVQKYALGLPFYRMGRWQYYLGVPVSPSTQWERCEHLVNSVYLSYKVLLDLSAEGDLMCGDDTSGRILDVEKQEKKKGKDKRSIWTTGITSRTNKGLITLFFTGTKHCGQNMNVLLKARKEEAFAIFMSDALSRNLPKERKVLWAKCNTHARRNFWDYRKDCPQHVNYALFLFGKIYQNERVCQERNYSAGSRLIYHQKHSARIMKKLRRWAILQICRKKVEPNSELGSALKYFLKHYKELTLFLRIPGVPLDNNVVESLLKVPILNRKNAYFYKTQFGALVGDILMSLIETCKKANKNPFNYLLSLHQNRELVKIAPEKWLPWNYELALPSG